MTKPWRETLSVDQNAHVDRVVAIARELGKSEERERCAGIAEGYLLAPGCDCSNSCGPAIALRLRSDK